MYRDFVWYEGWDDPADTQHKQQAGPNSAANNRDLCFAYSSPSPTTTIAETGAEAVTVAPAGQIWRNGAGDVIADLGRGESITPSSPGVTAFRIPKGSGLTNQEAQAVDHDGGVHVLNRDCCPSSDSVTADDVDSGHGNDVRWKHYYRNPATKTWTSRALPCGYVSGKRGRLAVSRDNDLYFVLPGGGNRLSIWRAVKSDAYNTYNLIWNSGSSNSKGDLFPPTEPLVDTYRLDHDNVLSVFTRRYAAEHATTLPSANPGEGGERKIDVAVLDFQL